MTEEAINKLKDEVDNYEQTVHAIVSFAHLIRWDQSLGKDGDFKSESHFFVGRKMKTSSKNKIQPNNQVTPDIIVQNDGIYGIVGEVKKTLPQNQNYWNKLLNQIQKYDDDLVGWKTESELMPTADVVLLTHLPLKRNVLRYIHNLRDSGEIRLDKNFAYIVFTKFPDRVQKIAFETVYGKLSNNEIDDTLRDIIPIPLQDVLFNNKDVKLYDSEPPLPYMMDILWTRVFPQMVSLDDFMESKGKKIMKFTTDVSSLKRLIKEQYTFSEGDDDRQPDIPKSAWIKKAMEKFVELGYAEKNKNQRDSYNVKYKKIESPLDTFCLELIQGKQSKGTTQYKQDTLEKYIEDNWVDQ